MSLTTHNARPITQYYHTYQDGRFKPVLRSAACLPVEHVEVHYKDKAVPVAYTPAPRGLTTSKRRNGAVLIVPLDDDQAFNDLMRFMTTGSYAPSISKGGGPPRIGQAMGSQEPLCLTDIRAYRLGAQLELPELQEHALQRLWSHQMTYEDPVVALEYAYHGPPQQPKTGDSKKAQGNDSKGSAQSDVKEQPPRIFPGGETQQTSKTDSKDERPRPPDEALRAWVRAWLKQPIDGHRCNLELLRSHAGWNEAWRKLRARGGPLIADVDAVEDELLTARPNRDRWLGARGIPIESSRVNRDVAQWSPGMSDPGDYRFVEAAQMLFGGRSKCITSGPGEQGREAFQAGGLIQGRAYKWPL